jgi:hypothetical protein
VDAEPLLPTPRAYRLFESQSDVTLLFIFTNQSESALGISPDLFEMGVALQVAVQQIPISTLLEWDTAMRRPGDSVTEISSGEQLRVGSHEGFEWRAIVRRADGTAFEPAEYEMDVDLTSSLRAVQNLDTGVYGIRGLSTTRLPLVIESPTTATTRAAMYRVRAQAALREGRPADAIAAFVQALELRRPMLIHLPALGMHIWHRTDTGKQ